jgi:hypothetical protein
MCEANGNESRRKPPPSSLRGAQRRGDPERSTQRAAPLIRISPAPIEQHKVLINGKYFLPARKSRLP